MKKPTKIDISKNAANAVETYLYYPKLAKAECKGNFTRFFDRPINLDEDLENCVIFLNQNSAFQYSRFMNKTHVVLKAYVPHEAIEGRTQGLAIKKGYITKAHIHGCYPGVDNGAVYLTNPYFNKDSFN